MVPAIKSAHATKCIDEDSCDLERVMVCGFNGTNTAGRVKFLSCIDSSDGDAPAIAKPCCTNAGIDYKTLLTCYNGDLGYALLGAAAAKFVASKVNVLPTMQVGSKLTPEPYAGGIEQDICKAGSTASICSSNNQTQNMTA